MPRNIVKKQDEQEVPQAPAAKEETNKEIVEREINLSLINDKLNYLIGVVHKIAEACEVEIN